MPKQFWVIGNEYRDMEFRQIVDGTTRVHGPFGDYEEARIVWRERSLASRAQATARYTIVSNVQIAT